MKFYKKFLINIIIAFTLFSCGQKPARVLDHSSRLYDDKRLTYNKYDKKSSRLSSHYGKKIEVRPGDSLYLIAKRYKITLRDLIKANDLSPPYILREGSKIKIPAPDYHIVKRGDNLYDIAHSYNMKLGQIIQLNNLERPYVIKEGDKIFISKSKTFKKSNSRVASNRNNKVRRGIISRNLSSSGKFSWPVRGVVISAFGPKEGGRYNDGINIKASEGSAVKASDSGVVAYVGDELRGYGNLVIVKHSRGWITAYAHLKDYVVRRGDKVKKGQKIGLVGMTGKVKSPQLYFGIRKGRDAVDPKRYL